MSIEVVCPDCAATQTVGDDKSGLRLRCRSCGAIISIQKTADGTKSPRSSDSGQAAPKSTCKTPLSRLVRPAIYGFVSLFTIGALGFRWWFNPPPPKPTSGLVNQSPNARGGPTVGTQPQSSASADKYETPPSPPPNENVRKALNDARAELAKNGKTEHFLELLRSVATELPEIQLSTEPDKVNWNKFTLYEHGLLLNAFRFTSPLEVPGDFFWCFASPVEVGNWFIVPAGAGVFTDDQESHSLENVGLEGLEFPENSKLKFQELLGAQFKPQQTQIVYFASGDGKPVPLRVAARILPPMKYDYDRGSRPNRVLRKLGLSKLPKVSPTPDSRVLSGHPNTIIQIGWKPNGELVSIDAEGNIYTWNVHDANPISKISTGIRIDPEIPTPVAVTPDAKKAMLIGIGSSEPIVWDLEANQQVGTLKSRRGRPQLICVAPDGLSVYAACSHAFTGDGNLLRYDIVQWSLDTSTVIATLADVEISGYRIRATSAGMKIVGCAPRGGRANQAARVGFPLDLSQPAVSRTYPGYISMDSCLAQGGTREVHVDLHGYLRVFDAAQFDAPLYGAALPHFFYHVCPLTDDRFVALGTFEGNVLLYDTVERQVCMEWLGHQDWITKLAASPDGKLLASASKDGTIRLWNQAQRSHPELSAQTLVDSEGHELKPIPAAEFLMGSSPNFPHHPRNYYLIQQLAQESPQHRVRISRPFYMASKEVSVAKYRRFVEATGYVTTNEKNESRGQIMPPSGIWQPEADRNWRSPGVEQTEEHPVVQLTYEDAKAYCDWLSEVEHAVYRLPTEAEWEFACGADPHSQYSYFDSTISAALCANVADQSLRKKFNGNYGTAADFDDGHPDAAPVGMGLANRFGLSEMHGNVWEYCQDVWAPHYIPANPDGATIDPMQGGNGPHVCRGGSFCYGYGTARACHRDNMQLGLTQADLGFRVVREISP